MAYGFLCLLKKAFPILRVHKYPCIFSFRALIFALSLVLCVVWGKVESVCFSIWHRWFHLPSLTPSFSSKCHKLSSYIVASLESSFRSANLFVFCCWHKKTHITPTLQRISNSNRITPAKLFIFSGLSSLFIHICSLLWILDLYGLLHNCQITQFYNKFWWWFLLGINWTHGFI